VTRLGTWGHHHVTPRHVRKTMVELAGCQPINRTINTLACQLLASYRGPLVSVPRSLRRYLGRYIGGAR
jgi:hypothetical protein